MSLTVSSGTSACEKNPVSTHVQTQANLHEEIHTSTYSCKCWYTKTLSRHQSTSNKINKWGLEHLLGAIYQMLLVLKWFLYVFTQWSELMRKHVNISPDWAGSESRLVMALPRPPTNTVSYTRGQTLTLDSLKSLNNQHIQTIST